MPLNHPSADTLLAAVQDHLQHPPPDATAERYLRKVAHHCLGIVRRELEFRDALVQLEQGQWQTLLNSNEQDTHRLNHQLCARIDAGDVVLSDHLLAALQDIAALKLQIDHPGWDQQHTKSQV